MIIKIDPSVDYNCCLISELGSWKVNEVAGFLVVLGRKRSFSPVSRASVKSPMFLKTFHQKGKYDDLSSKSPFQNAASIVSASERVLEISVSSGMCTDQ